MNDQFDQLVSYIKQHLDQGVPEDHLRPLLHQHHWHAELVDKAFVAVKAPVTPTFPPLAPSPQQPASPHQPAPAQQQAWEQPTQHTAGHPSSSTPAAPAKYHVFRALGDTLHAIKNNTATFLLATLISYAAAAGSLFLMQLIIGKLFYGQFGLLFASASKMLLVLLGSLVLYTVWYAFAYAFALSATSLALYDGSEKRKSPLGPTLSASLARMVRVAGATALFALVTFWPMVLIIFLPGILLFSGHTGGGASLLLLLLSLLVAIVWTYIATVRFALAPYVALFEPNVAIRDTLKRSKHLLLKGGQWFLVKGFLLLLLLLIILAIVTHQNLRQLTATGNLLTNLFLIVLSVLINGTLVMLYRNRKIVRE